MKHWLLFTSVLSSVFTPLLHHPLLPKISLSSTLGYHLFLPIISATKWSSSSICLLSSISSGQLYVHVYFAKTDTCVQWVILPNIEPSSTTQYQDATPNICSLPYHCNLAPELPAVIATVVMGNHAQVTHKWLWNDYAAIKTGGGPS